MPTLNIPLILHAILEEYVLPWDGVHGIAHWARVLENGLRLAEETGANIEVVQLFAILHDSQQVNEHGDHDQGPRAARPAHRPLDDLVQLRQRAILDPNPPLDRGLDLGQGDLHLIDGVRLRHKSVLPCAKCLTPPQSFSQHILARRNLNGHDLIESVRQSHQPLAEQFVLWPHLGSH